MYNKVSKRKVTRMASGSHNIEDDLLDEVLLSVLLLLFATERGNKNYINQKRNVHKWKNK